ncbi:MAG: transporter substrate-binding protein, partial [Bradyrhizobium sp.]|nr:transporter substrate-binding protein [Bradyrhizobium sp.]
PRFVAMENVMTPQERQLVDDLFDRLSKVEGAPRDPDATDAIAQGLRTAPNALYALVQTVLLQDEALKRAHSRIQELEGAGEKPPAGGFLDSMRETVFGQTPQRGSVPNVRPPELPSRPTWNSGQVMQQAQVPGQYGQAPYGQPQGQPQGQPYGAQQAPMGGGGGSFLGTAAAAAAGMVGGSLLLGSIRSMMGGGGHQQSFGDTASAGDGDGHRGSIEDRRPFGDQSGGDLANQAGINDIGSSGRQASNDDGSQRTGLFDSASNDDDGDNHDDMDTDSDDFGGDSDDV